MADDSSTTTVPPVGDAPPVDTPPAAPPVDDDALGDAGKRALEAERAARKEAEKARKALEAELDKVRKAQMSEAEKAVAEAEARGRSAATVEFGQRLAAAHFVAEAAKRNPEFNAAAVLEDLNLAKYVTDSGEPDGKGLAAVVERLVPERPGNPRPSGDVGLGPRTPPPPVTDGTPRSLIAAGIAASDAAKR